MKQVLLIVALLAFVLQVNAQEYLFEFGTVRDLDALVASELPVETPIKWFDVNTGKDSWYFEGEELVCKGLPIGVIRSEKQYQNFIMHIEWKHMEAGGNSGTFVWSSAVPGENRLPDGVEVQMLELDWVNQNKKDGVLPPIAYVHGELFGVGGVETIPDNPRGTRSKSIENRCLGK
ncbi:MAG: DUF1080 domain-containing protein [Cyclobacteriaceae bacterium]|nr:DUF1080 domain-containing protein [Cyclobacteriaceae bacterium]